VDKPAGWTSFDVVAVARRTIGVRRVGHGGTLDPMATGLLAVLVGPATKFMARLQDAPKVYAAVVRFGSETATDDAAGETTRSSAGPAHAEAVSALAAFRGVIRQRPPAYAAVKVDGRRAYDLAREGKTPELAAREVQVHRLDVTEWNSDSDLGLLIVCSSGTYVRSLARDLGRSLGSAAHLAALRRLAIGSLEIREAIGIDALRAAGTEAALARLRPVSDAVLALDPRYLNEPADTLVG
jgi:tRNA pseudouridine55 synthase